MSNLVIVLLNLTAIGLAVLIYLNLQECVMSYKVYPDGTIEVISYDEEPNSLESDNEFLNQWNEENN